MSAYFSALKIFSRQISSWRITRPFQVATPVLVAGALGLTIFAQVVVAADVTHTGESWAMYKTAEQLYNSGHVRAARSMLQTLVHRPRTTLAPEMYCLLADCYLSDFEQADANSPGAKDAEKGLHAALKLDPECGFAYKDLASFCNMRGEYKEAVVYATKALQAKKPCIAALVHRSAAYGHLHESAKALSDIDAFVNSGTALPLHSMLKGDILLDMHRYDEAAASYRKALTGPSFKNLLVHKIVQCLEYQHKYSEAIVEVNKWLKIDRDNAQIFALRGHLEKENKDYKSAIADLSTAISLEPTCKYFKQRAELYTILGQNDLAKKDLQSAEN